MKIIFLSQEYQWNIWQYPSIFIGEYLFLKFLHLSITTKWWISIFRWITICISAKRATKNIKGENSKNITCIYCLNEKNKTIIEKLEEEEEPAYIIQVYPWSEPLATFLYIYIYIFFLQLWTSPFNLLCMRFTILLFLIFLIFYFDNKPK